MRYVYVVYFLEYETDVENENNANWKETLHEYDPHRVFKCLPYPKTGGRLGKCYLLWGNELKHDFFPFVAIVGPNTRLMIVMLCIPIIIFVCFLGSMVVYNSWRTWAVIVALVFFISNEFCLLMTTMSNPGIVFRGMQPKMENGKLVCSNDLS